MWALLIGITMAFAATVSQDAPKVEKAEDYESYQMHEGACLKTPKSFQLVGRGSAFERINVHQSRYISIESASLGDLVIDCLKGTVVTENDVRDIAKLDPNLAKSLSSMGKKWQSKQKAASTGIVADIKNAIAPEGKTTYITSRSQPTVTSRVSISPKGKITISDDQWQGFLEHPDRKVGLSFECLPSTEKEKVLPTTMASGINVSYTVNDKDSGILTDTKKPEIVIPPELRKEDPKDEKEKKEAKKEEKAPETKCPSRYYYDLSLQGHGLRDRLNKKKPVESPKPPAKETAPPATTSNGAPPANGQSKGTAK